MGEDDGDETDITDEHGDIRRRFVELWNVRTSGDAGALDLDAAWQPIANLLDGHEDEGGTGTGARTGIGDDEG